MLVISREKIMVLKFHSAPKVGVKAMFTEAQAAERLNVTVYTIARYRKNGEIAATKIGGRYYYTEAAIYDFIERRTAPAWQSPKPVSKSEIITSPSTALPSGKPHGLTGTPDKHAAFLLAHKTFSKPKSA
jgi:excisionase family DNA binding protein